MADKAKMNIVYVPIKDLKPAEYNPRRLTPKQKDNLLCSIEKFGLVDPIIVNQHPGREGTVIGGHARLRIARELKFKTVPVVYVDLDEAQEKELNLRLNKNTGEFDFDLLANFDADFLADIGWSGEELDAIFGVETEIEEDPKEKEIDEGLVTDNQCPKCGYVW